MAVIGLIFVAAAINISRVGTARVMATTAANQSAAMMASYMASYGQAVVEQYLGGRREKCDHTSVLTAIIAIIVFIILVWVTWGIATVFVIAVAFVMLVINLVIQVAVVQPGITNMWNKLTKGLGETDMHMEGGVQTALSNSISDQSQVPDFLDFDMDGFVCDTTAGCDPQVRDTVTDFVNRYAYYNTMRLRGIQRPNNASYEIIEQFIDALRDLVWKENEVGDFGLMDPAGNCGGGLGPAECDPCCVSEPACCAAGTCADIGDCVVPPCCADSSCGDASTCAARSPYGNSGDPNPIYPYVYESGYFEIRGNNIVTPPPARNDQGISFREDIGRDDEHHLYRKSSTSPNGEQTHWSLIGGGYGAAEGFFVDDATSYYGFPDPDRLPGIFPFFYKLADWGAELSALTYGGEECHWCNSNPATGGAACLSPFPSGLTQLYLDPNDPALGYAGGQCVDNANRVGWVPGDPPQLLDNVYVPDAGDPLGLRFFADPNACAYGPNAASFWEGWKRGSDRFCNTGYPHYSKCAKHGWSGGTASCVFTNPDTGTTIPVNCECGEAGALPASAWQDDFLDYIFYNMIPQIYSWAITLVYQSTDALISNFDTWYPDAAEFIEPPGGVFFILRDIINSIYALTDDWVAPTVNPGYISGACTESTSPSVWCVPPPTAPPTPLNLRGQQECCGITASEAATFDADGNGTRGDLADVVACLDWQYNNTVTYSTGSYTGNAAKFRACRDNCDVEHCSNLPRSVIPGFCAIPFVASNAAAVALYDTCLATTTTDPLGECAVECGVAPAGPLPPVPPGLTSADWVAPQLADIASLLDTTDPFSVYNQCFRDRSLTFSGPNYCDPAWVPSTITCGSPTAFRNDVEAQICNEQGTCCDFPPPGTGINAFYDSIINALSAGICGAIWNTTNNHYLEVYTALGSCYDNSPSNVFQNAVLNARNFIAVPCQIPPVVPNQDGIDCDASDIAAFDACLADITDGTAGCVPGTCDSLPAARSSDFTVSYNIPPYAAGLAAPVGIGSVCDDTVTGTGTIPGLQNCLTTCSQINCWTAAFGGTLPTSSCNGNTFTYTLENPSFALVVPGRTLQDDADNAIMQSCLANCVGNQLDCQAVAGLTLNSQGDPYNIVGPFVPPDTVDVNFLQSTCLTGVPCTAGDACDTWNAGILDCASATYVRSQIENCAATLENSCSAWGTGIDPSDLIPLPTYYDLVLNARDNAAASCAATSVFRTMLEDSIYYAEIQEAKAQKRADYLRDLLISAEGMRDLMESGVNEITAFLDNWTPEVDTPAERLIDASDNDLIQAINALSSTVVYMWRDDDLETPRQDGSTNGLWHAVKVEARIPRRCNNACGSSGGSDPDWPTVETSTSGFLGTKRCYFIVNTTGMVKARVIRWDEDRAAVEQAINLPSGRPLWNIRFSHPSVGGSAGDPNIVFNECTPLVDPRLAIPGGYSQAVMLYDNLDTDGNNVPDFLENPSEAYWRCWTGIHNELLAYGSAEETCAQYFWASGSGLSGEGFSLSFIPCDSGFLAGSN
jgi:hypothetical protein